MNTAHRAAIAGDSGLQVDIDKQRSARQCHPVTHNQHAAFLAHLSGVCHFRRNFQVEGNIAHQPRLLSEN